MKRIQNDNPRVFLPLWWGGKIEREEKKGRNYATQSWTNQPWFTFESPLQRIDHHPSWMYTMAVLILADKIPFFPYYRMIYAPKNLIL